MLYSTQIYAGPINATVQTLYTVPAGNLLIVRDIDVATITAATFQAWFTMLGIGTFALLDLPARSPLASSAQWKGRQVFNAGQAVRGLTSPAGSAVCIVSGYLFTLP